MKLGHSSLNYSLKARRMIDKHEEIKTIRSESKPKKQN